MLGGDLRGTWEGWTAAHLAVIEKSPEAIYLLIAMGIPVDVSLYPEKKEESPLAFVVDEIRNYGYNNDREEMHDIVCQLVNAGADIFASTDDGSRCIDGILTHFDEAFALNFLHEYVCEPMQYCTNKDAPANLLDALLALLTAEMRRDVLEKCLVECIDFDLRESKWEYMSVRLVSSAILKKSYSVLSVLIDRGAGVHAGDVLAEALDEAAQDIDVERVRILLENGADMRSNPLHFVGGCSLYEHDCYAYTECVRLLRQHVDIFDPKWMREESPIHCLTACDFKCNQFYGHHWQAAQEALAPLLPEELVFYIQSFFDVSELREKYQQAYHNLPWIKCYRQ